MTRVKAGSVRQNCLASSRAAAVQRLCPIITSTESPGRTLRATASSSVVTTRPPDALAVGVTKPASRRTRDHEIPGPASCLTPTKPDHRVRLAISTMPGTTMHRAWDRRESSVTRRPPRRSSARSTSAKKPKTASRAVSSSAAGSGGRTNGVVALADADAVGAPASKRVLRSQGRRTMRKLLDAAMVAFDQRGYHATRVNDVVEIAKTSHGTFYLYFSNKEDLLRALVAEASGEAQNLYDALSTLPVEGGAPQVGGRARMDPGLLRTVDPLRAALPGLDRLGHDRPGTARPDPQHLHLDVGRTGQADQSRLVGPHHSTPMPPAWPPSPCSTASTTSASSWGNRSTMSLSRR